MTCRRDLAQDSVMQKHSIRICENNECRLQYVAGACMKATFHIRLKVTHRDYHDHDETFPCKTPHYLTCCIPCFLYPSRTRLCRFLNFHEHIFHTQIVARFICCAVTQILNGTQGLVQLCKLLIDYGKCLN